MKSLLLALLLPGLLLVGCKTSSVTPPEKAEANGLASATGPATNRALPVLFLAGDSTVHNTSPGLVGWGDVLGKYFEPTRITVENHAHAGRSTRTFISQGWWGQILAQAQPGDFVIIQLGHNDSSPINDTNRSRGTIPGLGEETTNIVNGLTHKPETVHTYGWYMRKYIADSRSKRMTPIICTSVSRLPQPGKELDTTLCAAWARAVAADQNVPLIDLNQRALDRWAGKPIEQIKTNYFVTKDNTHFTQAGAELNAECVIEGLRALTNCPLVDFLLPDEKRINAPGSAIP